MRLDFDNSFIYIILVLIVQYKLFFARKRAKAVRPWRFAIAQGTRTKKGQKGKMLENPRHPTYNSKPVIVEGPLGNIEAAGS